MRCAHHVLDGVDVALHGALVAGQGPHPETPGPRTPVFTRACTRSVCRWPPLTSGSPYAARYGHPAIAVQTREWIDLR